MTAKEEENNQAARHRKSFPCEEESKEGQKYGHYDLIDKSAVYGKEHVCNSDCYDCFPFFF